MKGTASQDKTVYAAVFRRIERDLKAGRYQPGDLLPTEEQLVARHHISRYAAREVYAELARRGLVTRVKRKGTVATELAGVTRLPKIGLILIAEVPAFFLFENGVEQVLGDHGTGLRVAYNASLEDRNEAAISDMLSHGVDGLIIAPPPHSSMDRYRRMVAEGFPVVIAAAQCPGVHSVYPDDHAAGLLIGEHLGERGFKRPALVTDFTPYAQVRTYGFREGLARHGVGIDPANVVPLNYASDAGQLYTDLGRRETERILQLAPRPDCVLAINDVAAISVYYWLMKAGLRVPEDIAVAGIDHIGLRFHPFQLTTVDIGIEEMGRAAAELLLAQVKNPDHPPTHREVKPRLIVSASTQPRSA